MLQTLNAFPMAGSQTYFLRILLIVVVTISLADGLRGLSQTAGLSVVCRKLAWPVAAVTLAGVAFVNLIWPLLML